MRSCGSCSAWEKTEAGSGQSGNRQRTAALPSSRSPFRMHRRLWGQLRPPSLCRKRRQRPCQRRSQRPYRMHRLHPYRWRSRNLYSRSPKRSPRPVCSPGPSRNPNQSQRRSAAVHRSRLQRPSTAKHPAAADWGSGAKNRSTENRKETKSPQVRWISGLWAFAIFVQVLFRFSGRPGRRHRKGPAPCGWHPPGSSGPAPRCGRQCPLQIRISGWRTAPGSGLSPRAVPIQSSFWKCSSTGRYGKRSGSV